MTGLSPEVGTTFLNIVGKIVVREGGRFAAGDVTTELAEGPAMPVLEVTDKSDLTAVHLRRGSGAPDRVEGLGGQAALGAGYANPPGSQQLLGPL